MASEKRQWKGQSRGGGLGVGIFVGIIRTFGVGCAYFLLCFVAVYFIPFAPKATAAIWKYNRKRLGLGIFRSAKELYMHYFVFGQTLIDKIAIRSGLTDPFSFEFDNYSRFLEIIDGKEGVVLLGAHIGCWEAGSAFFGKYGRKINIVMFDAERQAIKDAVGENTVSGDYKIIPVNEDPIEAMVRIKIALNNGEYICFNGDRYLDEASAVRKDFLGAKAPFPSGPFRIAAKCRVPVVFYYAVRKKGRKYRFIFTEPTVPPDGKQTAGRLMDEYIASLEKTVRRYPRQWFNFYDFWDSENPAPKGSDRTAGTQSGQRPAGPDTDRPQHTNQPQN